MVEFIQGLAGYGVSIDTAAIAILLYRLEKRIMILELTLNISSLDKETT